MAAEAIERSKIQTSMSGAAAICPTRMTAAIPGDTSREIRRVFCHCASPAALSMVRSGFRPVTDAMLQNPTGDWPNWRRTLDGWVSPPTDHDATSIRYSRVVVGLAPSPADALVSNGDVQSRARAAAFRLPTPPTATCSGHRARPADDGAPRTSPMRTSRSTTQRSTSLMADARLIALNAHRRGRLGHQVADTKLSTPVFERTIGEG